jgi:hypothetical protein
LKLAAWSEVELAEVELAEVELAGVALLEDELLEELPPHPPSSTSVAAIATPGLQ